MIRLRPFEKMSYTEIREKYLEQLVTFKVVDFDDADILDNGPSPSNGKTAGTYDKLEKFQALREYLYESKEEIRRERLRQLLIGPDEAPRSLGGEGELVSMRSVFEKIISDIEECGSNSTEIDVKVCKEIFKYERLNIIENDSSENLAYWLQRQLGVEVCPYCNRIYTTTLHRKKRIRPDFDHFYPQSRYPYFAVSLFNLIPSCSMCNRGKSDKAEIKGDIVNLEKTKEKTSTDIQNLTFTDRQKKSIIYPYDESYNELQTHISFRVIPYEKQKEVMMGQSDKFIIELRPTKHSEKLIFDNSDRVLTKTELDKRFECHINSGGAGDTTAADDEELLFWDRAKNSIDLLRIESLYNEHKAEIMKMLRNHYQYNQAGIQLIMQTLSPTADPHEALIYARNMLYFAFLSPEEWGKSPLNKLKSDILDQLDEIENTRIDS